VTVFVALLRAVNVGTANRIRMDALRTVFHAAGYVDATTHIQSGNVIFSSADEASVVRARIERHITSDLGLSITAIVRSADELGAIGSGHPLAASTSGLAGDPSQLYVTFLSDEPSIDDVAALVAMSFGDDELIVVGREVFVRYAQRASQSKLTNALIEKKLRCASTTRNWAVICQLVELTR
jgi:uncharacterized protein (DUF1697 family)